MNPDWLKEVWSKNDDEERYSNLPIKKISQAVLSRCEWGKDDYCLQVENLSKAPLPKGQMESLSVGEG